MLRASLALLLVAVFTATSASASAPRNLFVELLGKTEAEVSARIDSAWDRYSSGDPATERLCFDAPDGTAYLANVGARDVRSEGMSYGMMIAVLLDRKDQFDRFWKWTQAHMLHRRGLHRGYFAWQCAYDGTVMDPNSASDGEEWIATALFFASHRWGDGEGVLAYSRHGQDLLRAMLHRDPIGKLTPIFDRKQRQVVFCPIGDAATFTDPSYHLPHFYTLWARWARDPADRAFWAEAAAESRAFFKRHAHPVTGLMSEYAHFDGRPYEKDHHGDGRDEFAFDSWRTLAFVALDHAWGSDDPWQVEQTDRVLRFLHSQGDALTNRYKLDGTPLGKHSSPGLVAMAAAAGVAASDREAARYFLQRLWDQPLPTGKWRYYDGLLTVLGLLQASGRFQIFDAPSAAHAANHVSPVSGDALRLRHPVR